MELLLRRTATINGQVTFGSLLIGPAWECYSLEDCIREVPGEPVSSWKIPGHTAIPAGRYHLVLRDSAHFGPDTFELKGVSGFSDILIHAGNGPQDTEGCVLVGQSKVTEPAPGRLVRSRLALEALKAKVVPVIKSGEVTWITVRNPG